MIPNILSPVLFHWLDHLRPDEYAKLYGDKELDDIIKDKKDAANEWKNDSGSLSD